MAKTQAIFLRKKKLVDLFLLVYIGKRMVIAQIRLNNFFLGLIDPQIAFDRASKLAGDSSRSSHQTGKALLTFVSLSLRHMDAFVASAEAAVRRALAVHQADPSTASMLGECLRLCSSQSTDVGCAATLISSTRDSPALLTIAALRALGCCFRRGAYDLHALDILQKLIARPITDAAVAATMVQTIELLVRAAPCDDGKALTHSIDESLNDCEATEHAFTQADDAQQLPVWCRHETLLLSLRAVCQGHTDAIKRQPSGNLDDWPTELLRICISHASEAAGSRIPYIRSASLGLLTSLVTLYPASLLASLPIDERQHGTSALAACITALTMQCASSAHHQAHLSSLGLARALVDRAADLLPAYHTTLLPWLCYSRYFGPERHRYVAIETWKRLVSAPSTIATVASMSGQLSASTEIGTVAANRANSAFSSPSSITSVTMTAAASSSSSYGSQPARGRDLFPNAADGSSSSARTARAASPMRRFSVTAYLQSMTGGTAAGDVDSPSDVAARFPVSASPVRQVGNASSVPASVMAAPVALPSGSSSTGPLLLQKHVEPVTTFYLAKLRCADADSQEAACHCVAELATKVDAAAVRPYASEMLDAVMACLQPSSRYEWFVRDAATVATVKLALAFFTSKSGDDGIAATFVGPACDLPSLWLRINAADEHRMVRDHAAMVLGLALTSLQPTTPLIAAEPRADDAAGASLLKAADGRSIGSPLFASPSRQASQSVGQASSPSPSSSPRFSRSPLHRAGDSPAPLVAGPRSQLLVDVIADVTSRVEEAAAADLPRDPTEQVGSSRAAVLSRSLDGAVYLVRELAHIDPPATAALLLRLGEGIAQSWCQLSVREAMARHLPDIAKAVGKQAFKRSLDAFLPPLCKFVGPSIFDGRVTPEQAAQLSAAAARP